MHHHSWPLFKSLCISSFTLLRWIPRSTIFSGSKIFFVLFYFSLWFICQTQKAHTLWIYFYELVDHKTNLYFKRMNKSREKENFHMWWLEFTQKGQRGTFWSKQIFCILICNMGCTGVCISLNYLYILQLCTLLDLYFLK
jgi:hypothetical protein